MKKITILTLALLMAGLMGLLLRSSASADDSPPEPRVDIFFFWGDGCPHCAQEKLFLGDLIEKYPQVVLHDYEVYYHEENQLILQKMAEKFGFEPRYVPITIISDQYWIGFSDDIKTKLEQAVQECLQSSCEVAMDTNPASENAETENNNIVHVPLIGPVDLAAQSLALSTAIIGFVDGFNPCSLWVLSVLLAITLHSGSRAKILTVGFTFLIVTAVVYSLFIAGVFTLFSYMGYLRWIQIGVALIAFIFAAVNIKDYFWYKQGVSFTISDKHKPKLYQNMRSTVVTPRSLRGLIASTSVLAVGVSLIEFTCTAGFPVIWSNLIVANNVGGWAFVLLLGLYIFIYLLDELAVFGAVAVTMKTSRVDEKHGRVLKLISGMIILALGLVMLINPEWMNQLSTSLLVFAAALLGAWVVYFTHQRILPHFGVYIGSGFKHPRQKRKRRH